MLYQSVGEAEKLARPRISITGALVTIIAFRRLTPAYFSGGIEFSRSCGTKILDAIEVLKRLTINNSRRCLTMRPELHPSRGRLTCSTEAGSTVGNYELCALTELKIAALGRYLVPGSRQIQGL